MKNSDYCEHMAELWKAIEELQGRVKKLEEDKNNVIINSGPYTRPWTSTGNISYDTKTDFNKKYGQEQEKNK